MPDHKVLGEDVTHIAPVIDELPPVDEDKYFDSLVGEGKKYKDPNALAKANIHATLRIKELTEELKAKGEHDLILDEILGTLRSTSTQQNPPAHSSEAATDAPPANSSQVSADAVGKIVEDKLSAAERERANKRNQEISLNKLTEVYGDKAKALYRLKQIIDAKPDMEMVINLLGNTDPDGLVKMVVAYSPPSGASPNTPGFNDGQPIEANTTGLTGYLTWTEARKTKKDDPKRYASREFRSEIERSAAAHIAAGKDFFAT